MHCPWVKLGQSVLFMSNTNLFLKPCASVCDINVYQCNILLIEILFNGYENLVLF